MRRSLQSTIRIIIASEEHYSREAVSVFTSSLLAIQEGWAKRQSSMFKVELPHTELYARYHYTCILSPSLFGNL